VPTETLPDNWYTSLADAVEALGKLPAKHSPFAVTLETGSLRVGIYAPRDVDKQKPHTQDEVYFVMSGRGMFVNGDTRVPFGPGDTLFVPAGVVHRFEDFTDDLYIWVVFYGPEGGESQ